VFYKHHIREQAQKTSAIREKPRLGLCLTVNDSFLMYRNAICITNIEFITNGNHNCGPGLLINGDSRIPAIIKSINAMPGKSDKIFIIEPIESVLTTGGVFVSIF
jgi:hypothetical protein